RAAPVATGETVKRWAPWAILVGGVIVLQLAFSGAETFPARLDSLLEDPIDDAGGWMRANRLTHPLFTSFFTPISDAVGWVISSITDLLLWLPWYVVIASAAVFPARKRRWLDTAVVV